MTAALDTSTDVAANFAPAATSQAAAGWVVIVGASSGIGKAVARHWASKGSNLILSGRDLNDLERSASDLRIRYACQVEVVYFDALAFDSHREYWSKCEARAGNSLDGVVLLHGSLPVQAEAQSNPTLLRQTIETNFTSACSILELAAEALERKGCGFLCVFSSVAGDRGRQSNYVYGSSKAAVSTYLSGLRNRLFKRGVKVVTVKPGFVDTAMTWGLPGVFLVASPQKVAADAYAAVRKGRAEIYTPWFWRYIMLIIKSLPGFIFNRMKL
jgi:short-subunit dehydrogenase